MNSESHNRFRGQRRKKPAVRSGAKLVRITGLADLTSESGGPGVGGKPAQGTPNREFGFDQRGDKPQDALSSSGTFHDRKSLGSVYTLQRKR